MKVWGLGIRIQLLGFRVYPYGVAQPQHTPLRAHHPHPPREARPPFPPPEKAVEEEEGGAGVEAAQTLECQRKQRSR